MRVLTLLAAALLSTPALADWGGPDYVEERELSLSAEGIEQLEIEAGAGSMRLRGESGADAITVRARVLVDGVEDDEAREFVARHMRLTLERRGERAELVSRFEGGGSSWGSRNGAIALEIVVPRGMALDIDDGSGSIEIEETFADVRVEDGSGSLSIRSVASLDVDDGSGSLDISDVSGDVRIEDGSGSVRVERVAGSVSVRDGSGSIMVDDVAGDFRVIRDGSGSVRYSDVLGQVDVPND